jgi:hypothetical protein
MIEALCEQYSVSYRPSTPCRSDADLSITRPTEDETVNPTAYQSIIGSLSYISQMTRPDIMFIISKLAQRNANPAEKALGSCNPSTTIPIRNKGPQLYYKSWI